MHAQLFLLFKCDSKLDKKLKNRRQAVTNGFMPKNTTEPKKFLKSNLCFEFFLLYYL